MKKRKPSVSLHLPESTAPRHLAVMIRADGTVETVDVGEEITLHRLQELVGDVIILSVDRDDFVGLTDSQASAIRSMIPLTVKSRGYTKEVVFR